MKHSKLPFKIKSGNIYSSDDFLVVNCDLTYDVDIEFLVTAGNAYYPMLENAKKILEGFDKNIFRRNIDDDDNLGWGLKILPYINALAKLQRSIEQAEEK